MSGRACRETGSAHQGRGRGCVAGAADSAGAYPVVVSGEAGPLADSPAEGGPAEGGPAGGGEIPPEHRFDDLVDEIVAVAGVTPPRGGGGFGRSGLRFQNKIFAMLVRGRLVLKLPAERVDALIADGEGVRFDANKGTPMKEWFSLDPESGLGWLALAREALDFARSGR